MTTGNSFAIWRHFANLVTPRSSLAKRACEWYIDRYNGDNNCNPSRNGEELLLRQELPKCAGKVVFDIGANVGDWARYALEVEPNIQLHCFEPSSTTFERLSAREWPASVKLNNFGLSESEGEVDLNIVEAASGMNSMYRRRAVAAASRAVERVQVTTTDSYCARNGIEHIGFMKADVEGHELAVFQGMEHLLRANQVDMIQFEYGGCNLDARIYLSDIWDFLEPYGFRFFKLFPEGPRPCSQYDVKLETFKYSNWLAKRDAT